jgi:hypothetical protein
VNGYDVYTPNKNIVGHDYQNKMTVVKASARPANPMEWTSHGNVKKDYLRVLYDQAVERIDLFYASGLLDSSSGQLLSEDAMIEKMLQINKYGLLSILGNPKDDQGKQRRDIFDFMSFTGIDTMKKEVFDDRCKSLQWVPWKADSDPFTNSMDLFGHNAEVTSDNKEIIPIDQSRELEMYSIDAYTQFPSSPGGVLGGAHDPVASMEIREPQGVFNEAGKSTGNVISSLSDHRGGELWFVFQFIDSFLEKIINKIDVDVGYGHGHKVMRTVLLFFPLICFLIGFGMWILAPSSSSSSSMSNKIKQ